MHCVTDRKSEFFFGRQKLILHGLKINENHKNLDMYRGIVFHNKRQITKIDYPDLGLRTTKNGKRFTEPTIRKRLKNIKQAS